MDCTGPNRDRGVPSRVRAERVTDSSCFHSEQGQAALGRLGSNLVGPHRIGLSKLRRAGRGGSGGLCRAGLGRAESGAGRNGV